MTDLDPTRVDHQDKDLSFPLLDHDPVEEPNPSNTLNLSLLVDPMKSFYRAKHHNGMFLRIFGGEGAINAGAVKKGDDQFFGTKHGKPVTAFNPRLGVFAAAQVKVTLAKTYQNIIDFYRINPTTKSPHTHIFRWETQGEEAERRKADDIYQLEFSPSGNRLAVFWDPSNEIVIFAVTYEPFQLQPICTIKNMSRILRFISDDRICVQSFLYRNRKVYLLELSPPETKELVSFRSNESFCFTSVFGEEHDMRVFIPAESEGKLWVFGKNDSGAKPFFDVESYTEEWAKKSGENANKEDHAAYTDKPFHQITKHGKFIAVTTADASKIIILVESESGVEADGFNTHDLEVKPDLRRLAWSEERGRLCLYCLDCLRLRNSVHRMATYKLTKYVVSEEGKPTKDRQFVIMYEPECVEPYTLYVIDAGLLLVSEGFETNMRMVRWDEIGY